MTDPVAAGHYRNDGDELAGRQASSGSHKPGMAKIEREDHDFDAVYAAQFQAVWRCLLSLGVPHAAIDDATQEVFLVVHRRLSDFEGRSSLRTWILAIAAQVARNHRRHLKRKGGGVSLAEDALESHRPSPLETAERSERLAILDALLGEIGDDQREVFVLAEIEGQSAVEISEALQLSVNTVHSRLRAARKSFEKAVRRYRARNRGSVACIA